MSDRISPPQPTHRPPPLSRRSAWILGLAAAAVPVALHAHFIAADARLPRDLGLFYQRMPRAWHFLTGEGGTLGQIASDLGDRPGGAYEALLALWLHLVGRSPAAFQVLDIGWMVSVLALCAACTVAIVSPKAHARATGASPAPTAAVIAVLLAGGMPFLAIFPRLSWIHVPETALILGAALPWLRSPTLERGLWWTALLGAAAIQLRTSALPWLAPLAVGLVLGVDGRRPPLRRLAVIGLAWLLAALPSLVGLLSYLSPKLDARMRYARDVPPFAQQVLIGAGPIVPLLAVGGALLAWRHRRSAPVRLLTAWSLLTVLLWAGFRAGMDNFLVGFAALAVLTAVGLSHQPRLGLALAVLPWLLLHLPRFLPAPPEPSIRADTLGKLNQPPHASLHSPYRPFTQWGRAHLDSLLLASCPSSGQCKVAVDQGLLTPYSEEPGRLELFLAGHDAVDLVDLRAEGRAIELPQVHALVHYDCGDRDLSWRQRFPRSLDRLFHLIEEQELEPAWSKEVSGDCRVLWFTPDGAALDPAALPDDGDDLSTLKLPAMTGPRSPHPLDVGGPMRRADGQVRPHGKSRPTAVPGGGATPTGPPP